MGVRLRPLPVPLLLLEIALVLCGCTEDATSPSGPADPVTDPGSWTVYTPYAWAHDGAPYPSTFVTVYSDAADAAMKRQVADIADARFGGILDLFGVGDPTGLLYPPGSSSLDIYLNLEHPENINWAYWGGFILTVRSSSVSGPWYDYTVYTVRHELTHELEFLVEGREALGTDLWFREGLAVRVGCLEPTGWDTITEESELATWIDRNRDVPGRGNPISAHELSDLPDGADLHQYFRLFELAVRYLLDERGLHGSYGDVLGCFQDVRDGDSFDDSFLRRFGMSVSAFEEEFFDRAAEYLNGTASAVLRAPAPSPSAALPPG